MKVQFENQPIVLADYQKQSIAGQREKEVVNTVCAFCSAQNRFLYSWDGFDLLRCSICHTESIKQMPTQSELKEFYENKFYQENSQNPMERSEIRLKLIERSFAKYLNDWHKFNGRKMPESFLDIGGGVGYYVRAAQDEGIKACLMDYADSALNFARTTLGVNWTVQGDIQKCAEYLEHGSFDFILARHAVEHLLDPDEFIANICRLIRPGGLLEIETPNVLSNEQICHPMLIHFNYKTIKRSNPSLSTASAIKYALSKSMSGINPPKHLWGFTAQGLKLLLQKNGFEIIKVRRAIAGDAVFDPLYYEAYRLSTRKGLGIPYYFWERATSLFFKGRGMNLAILARCKG